MPRAIFQFNPEATGCRLEGFELSGAHNESHNGAGVRINQADHVTIHDCSIHDNDMGIMSNGNGSLASAVDQRIEHCAIHHNGDLARPGYNHNLYLGGTSVTLRFCEVAHSLTGHNVKSRAHYTRVEYCFVHDSANREFDLVDAAESRQVHRIEQEIQRLDLAISKAESHVRRVERAKEIEAAGLRKGDEERSFRIGVELKEKLRNDQGDLGPMEVDEALNQALRAESGGENHGR